MSRVSTQRIRFRPAASTILWTRRYNLPVREGHDPQQSGAGTISGATGFCGNRFAKGRLDVALVDVADPEEAGRGPFDGPGLTLIPFVLGVHDQLDMGISPVDFGE